MMKDGSSGAGDHVGKDGQDIALVELSREACEAISEMCAFHADMGCGCDICNDRLAQPRA